MNNNKKGLIIVAIALLGLGLYFMFRKDSSTNSSPNDEQKKQKRDDPSPPSPNPSPNPPSPNPPSPNPPSPDRPCFTQPKQCYNCNRLDQNSPLQDIVHCLKCKYPNGNVSEPDCDILKNLQDDPQCGGKYMDYYNDQCGQWNHNPDIQLKSYCEKNDNVNDENLKCYTDAIAEFIKIHNEHYNDKKPFGDEPNQACNQVCTEGNLPLPGYQNPHGYLDLCKAACKNVR